MGVSTKISFNEEKMLFCTDNWSILPNAYINVK